MIIFNRNIVFKSEEVLQDDVLNDTLETIFIIEKDTYPLRNHFSLISAWFPMSGQEMRYYSSIPFEQADRSLSWALEIKGVMVLIWDAEHRNILYSKKKGYSSQRLRFWIFHTFLPLVLELERTYHLLHTGSVEVAEKAVLFSALSFGGKSTLTDYFMHKGHAMLTDDSIAIEKQGDTYYAVPSYPFHRPYREVEALGRHVENVVTKPKPLHAVYLLEKSDPDAKVEIHELKGIEKFKAFHYSSFIDFSFMKKERFDFFTKMAKYIPVYNITIPWDIERLDEVYHAIVEMIGSDDMV